MTTIPRSLQSLALLGVLISSAPAAVLYSNFGPGQTFDGVQGAALSGSNYGSGQALAVRFQPSQNVTFQDAVVAMGSKSGANQVSLFLQTDNNGSPGAILEQIDFTLPAAFPPGGLVTAWSALHPALAGGTFYWLSAAALNPGTFAAWNANSTGDLSDGVSWAYNLDASPNGFWVLAQAGNLARPAFQIDADGAAAPESGSLLLTVLGAITLIVRRKSQTAINIEENNNA